MTEKTEKTTHHALPADFSHRLVHWQSHSGRHDMPWQTNRNPYRVWLSEIMLQQTQVATARGHYLRFLESFATLEDLANASLDEVLAQWSGLGYYSRAKNLHACAQMVVQKHGGEFPRQAKDLAELPGIGPSTAAAIASFCFAEPITIFDGNVQRVVSRIVGFSPDLSKAQSKRALQGIAQAALDAKRPSAQEMAAHTQGLMDLGATICTPKKPQCTRCPFETDCVAHAQGQELQYPVITKNKTRKTLHSQWVCVWAGDELHVAQRPDTGIWARLWTPLSIDPKNLPQLLKSLEKQGITWQDQPTIKHVLTHRDWFISALHIRLNPRQELNIACASAQITQMVQSLCEPARVSCWISREKMHTLGLPVPVTAIAKF